MAYASVTYTSASGTTFALTNSSGDPIEYIRQSDIAVYVNNVLQTLTTDYTFNSAGTAIVLNVAVSGATVLIQRTTDISDAVVVYTPGSTLTAQDLNNADNQLRYGLQEFRDYVNAAGAIPDGDKGDITVINNGTVWSIDNGVVTSAKIADGTIVNADINASAAIAGTKISPDFGSQNTTTTGTSTAASFIPTSSTAPTNGVYLPAANSVAISTNGTGRLFVDSTGNIGVGSASNVYAGLTTLTVGNATGSVVDWNIAGTRTGTVAVTASSMVVGSAASVPVVFQSANSERMRLDTSGRLGLGTSSPGYSLDIRPATGSWGINSQPATGTNQSGFRISNSSGEIAFGIDNSSGGVFGSTIAYERALYCSGAYPLRFYTNDTPRLTITSAGLVGIGVTAPEQLLHLGGNNGIRFGNASATPKADITYTSVGDEFLDIKIQGTTSGYGNIRFSTGGTPSERARIDSSGRLLVGTSTTTSAGELLRVEKASTGNEGAGIRLAGTFSLVNDGTQSINVGNGCLVFVSENTTGDGALFFCGYRSATVTLISDPNNRYANAVTAGRISLTKSANSTTATVTNKGGSSYTFTVGKINCSD